MKAELELKVGDKIRIGKEYANSHSEFKTGEIIELIKGYFEEENGLYSYTSTAPSIPTPSGDDFDSIYHLFGNNLEDFMDCEVIKNED